MADIPQDGAGQQPPQLWKKVVEANRHGIMIVDAGQADTPIIYVNPAFVKMTGYPEQEVMGKNYQFLHGEDRDQPVLQELCTALREQRGCRVVLRSYRKDGSLFWNELTLEPVQDEAGTVTHFIWILSDVTEHTSHAARLTRLASYDPVTQLPNRVLLESLLKQAVARCRRDGHKIALLLLDLDHFKRINDTLGHSLGDALLQAVATRLLNCLRAGDTLGRLGGDEFVVLLEGWQWNEQIAKVARKIQRALVPGLKLEEQEVFVTVSIGISLFPKDGEDGQTLLKNADIALYRAKARGRNEFCFYAAEMNARAMERLAMENDLRHSMDRGELELYYQPQLELLHQRTLGVEALLRWRHPKYGLVGPAEFVPLAEESGLIVPIGEWVLKTACAQAKTWQVQGLQPLRMAVNLSVAQFEQPDFTRMVARILSDSGLQPDCLELEITESLLMKDVNTAVAVLRTLKEMGVKLAIDDFGTGYSSLNYLKRLPIDRLKIDRSFVQDISIDPDDAAIALAVIAMAHSMNLRVVAEGVETDAQLTFLRSRDCDEMQGYYFSRPLPAGEATCWLEEHGRWEVWQEAPKDWTQTVLLVDDDPDILKLLEQVLRRDGYRVLTAANGRAGLELLTGDPVQVVISDLFMPEMNGIDFLKRVRKLYPGTVRIALSGYGELDDLIATINECAVFKFLAKPIALDALRDALRQAFLWHELHPLQHRLQ